MPKAVDQSLISLLNEFLTIELTSINQYFCHARMCANWGFDRLADIIQKESIEEMHHAQAIIDRILYLEGVPNLQRLGKVTIGETVKEQLQLDLEREYDAVPKYNEAIQKAAELGDNGTKMLLEAILKEEEAHIDWLEAQLELIETIGEANYLTQQIKN